MLQTDNHAQLAATHGAASGISKKIARAAADTAIALVVSVKAYWPIWAVVLAYVLGVNWWFGHVFTFKAPAIVPLLPAGLLAFAVYRLIAYALSGNMPEHPARQLWQDMCRLLCNRARLVSLILFVPLFYLFIRAFSVFKSNIALVHPFSWDETFMRLDAWLHGGRQPWEWLYPLLHSAAATTVVNFVYNLWFFIVLGLLLWTAVQHRPREIVVHYQLAFLLAWIIGGSFMALAFSSAGPVYYGRLGLSPDPFAPLMEHLRAVAENVPVWALHTQELLWRNYLAQDPALGGISAFPSMHNAQAMLIALLAWRFGGMIRWAGVVFMLFITIGSVWLGWHYAVDAYAGMAIGAASWWLAAPVARWMMARPAMHRLAELQRRLDEQAQ